MKFYIIIFLLMLSVLSMAQLKEVQRQTVQTEKFDLDKLGNFYFINDNVLKKTNNKLEFITSYDLYSLGDISLFDVSNPLRILLFYKDFNAVLFIDNNFSELTDPILLDDTKYYSEDAIASNQFGGVWIYNSLNSSVVCLDKDLETVQEGMNLYSVVGDAEILEMKLSTDFIVLHFDSNELVVLDKFANFYTKYTVTEGAQFDLDNNILYTIDEDGFQIINLDLKETSFMQLELDDVRDMAVSADKLYVLAENSLITFQILY
ncbi:MAG: hypothetical protein C0596_13790 [Marinilabiliales bacterium]|nr:MAG: hypothetical protein C0596_13790 [Marinilabiliales bacterium]